MQLKDLQPYPVLVVLICLNIFNAFLKLQGTKCIRKMKVELISPFSSPKSSSLGDPSFHLVRLFHLLVTLNSCLATNKDIPF